MGERIRAFDWTRTPLGPPAQWPQSLKTAVRIMLLSRQPIWIGWGPDLLYFYNDPYKSIIGGRHPRALGRPTFEVWRELWPIIEPMLHSAMAGAEGTYVEKQLLIMERNGYPEETYYTYSYTPIPDDRGEPGGIICANTDDTLRVIGERRLATLRDLATATSDLRDWRHVCNRAALAMVSNDRDLPFAMVYIREPESNSFALEACVRIARGHPMAPETVREDDASAPWPLAETMISHTVKAVDLRAVPDLPPGAWPISPSQALIIPVLASTPGGRSGVLVVGINPFRELDADYRGFLSMAAGQVFSSIAVAEAYENERRRAESLAELDRAKTAFFSNVSHEFRTPLTLMIGPAEDALAQESDREQRTRLETIHRNARRLQKLVNALLDFSRIEAGRARVAFAATDLSAFTAELASVFRSAIERAGMRLLVSTTPGPDEPVYVDRDMFEKVVLNLISNAFKYTLTGEIEVGVRDKGREVEVFVRDTGVGIAPVELPRLFDRFHRVEGVRARTHEGSGIGLALVQELVKLHHGHIAVESALGQGSTFTVTLHKGRSHLPADQISSDDSPAGSGTLAEVFADEAMRWLPDGSADAAEIPDLSQGAPGQRPVILLADDNADMREYVRKLLLAHFEVDAAADGRAAMNAALRRRPDLIVTDVMMPELDGFGLLREVREHDSLRDVPVLMLSARAGEEARLEGLTAGADDYLVKPFSGRELFTRVRTQLQLAKVRRESESRERALRAEAERAGRMKDEFLATLSHELRTPLNAILGWAHLLRRKPPTPENVAQGLTVIERNARVQSQLIADLLDMSRIISGKMRLDIQRVDLPTVIEAAMESIRPAAEAREVRVVATLDRRCEPLQGDPARIQQMVWNLLSNAVKFTPDGGVVEVALECPSGFAEIIVRDTGQGIAPDFLPHVFERFRQGDGSTSREHGGLGLGLAIVKQLVELHGGSAHAASAGVGMGSVFRIRLPLIAVKRADAAPDAAPPRPAPTAPSGEVTALPKVRVLLVDDEEDARDVIRRVLEDVGASVWTASSAREAHGKLAERTFDVIVSDIGMPDEDGYTFIRTVRDRGCRTPAAALTAFARGEDRAKAMEAGYEAHLAKPVDIRELYSTVALLTAKVPHAAI